MTGGTTISVGGESFDVDCRIGVHCGEAVGAIVGFVMQRYHLFGQSLNVGEVAGSLFPSSPTPSSARPCSVTISISTCIPK